MALTLNCPAVDQHGLLRARNTCFAGGFSPPLEWSGVAAQAVTLALVLLNLDAPPQPAVHWLVFNIPAQADELFEAVEPDMILDSGAKHGLNAARRPGYLPPCPAPDVTERFLFTLHALDRALPAGPGASLQQLSPYLAAAIGRAELPFAVRSG
ncbi:MAG: YbhB/YbcL family Raf kinase inhibitor-like protein [Desulfovibrionaceae bacterium]